MLLLPAVRGHSLGIITCRHDDEIPGAPGVCRERLVGLNALKCRELCQLKLSAAVVVIADRAPLQLLAGQIDGRKDEDVVAEKAIRLSEAHCPFGDDSAVVHDNDLLIGAGYEYR